MKREIILHCSATVEGKPFTAVDIDKHKEMETWKAIEGYESYEVSNLGNIRRNGKLINQSLKNGYLRVNLSKDGKYKNYYVHRLVALAFLPNPNNLPLVNHKDEIRTNNNIDNLEWCDNKYNLTYGTILERKGLKIYQLDMNGNFIKEWLGANDASRNLSIPQSNITYCCQGKRKSAGNYKWCYAV